jgi:AraC family transcriptional regulator
MTHDASLLEPLRAFRTPDAPRLLTRSVYGSALALTEVSGPAGHGLTAPIPESNAYLVQLRLRDCPGATYFVHGRALEIDNHAEGAIQFHDLRQDPRVELTNPFNVMHLNVKLAVLKEIGDEVSRANIDELHTRPGACYRDAVIEHLLRAMRPALMRPGEVNALFLDQVSTALCVHLVEAYAGTRLRTHAMRGGLAPWQLRTAKSLMQTQLDQDIGLASLAAACGLSIRHFTRAFKQSAGLSPYQYRLQCRIGHAKSLLQLNAMPISAIVEECGFANQSHFTRVFHTACGMSPGEWRRRHASAPFISLPR